MAHPIRLRFQSDARQLRVEFDSGEQFDIPYELLRVESPSAEVQGHGGDRPPPVTGKETIRVTRAEPVGQYAVRIVFDDGHNSGYYTWPRLYDLGKNAAEIEAAYRARVAEFASR
ncbi:MAG: hypothetical protein CMK09_12325 [Ponticaulis sp.]|nr:hypothetical protein [Ponticaulis sp.]|tara:strand:- start:3712 stop:4056 length:345 start_codon:yes stop_codon:yes gene_type:complete